MKPKEVDVSGGTYDVLRLVTDDPNGVIEFQKRPTARNTKKYGHLLLLRGLNPEQCQSIMGGDRDLLEQFVQPDTEHPGRHRLAENCWATLYRENPTGEIYFVDNIQPFNRSVYFTELAPAQPQLVDEA